MKIRFCIYIVAFLMPAVCVAGIEITEVAWMGTDVSYTDEWIELYNNGAEDVDLTNWVLIIQDKKDIVLEGVISTNSYYLIERTDDDTVLGIIADLVHSFGTGLTNTGAVLILRNGGGSEVDKINALEGWPAGDNDTKETMQKSGSIWITAIGTPKAQNTKQEEETESPEESSENQSSSNQEEYVPPEDLPSIKSYAGKDKTMVSGALGVFRGEAYGFKNEPLENARYLWNLGDGTTKESKNINHFYRYPGNYVVALYVSSGENTASDRMIVKVIANEIIISEVKTGADSFVEFQNGSNETINMSGWSFRSGKQKFTFSKNSFIGPGFFLTVPASSSGVLFSVNSGKVELLYPNRLVADTINYNGILKNGESFSRDVSDNDSYITKETPGEVNEMLSQAVPIAYNKENYKKPPVQTVQAPRQNSGQAISIDTTDEKETESSENEKQVYQEANIISASQESGLGKWFYFGLVLALASLSGLGVFVVRRKKSKSIS